MNIHRLNPVGTLKMLTLCLVTALSASGCATVPVSSETPGPRLEPAPLPVYSQGTTFVYSDGTWETVIEASPAAVTWSDYRNYVSSGLPDFTHRRTKQEFNNRSVTRQFGPRTNLFVKTATTLWPLQVGNVAGFSETGTWLNQDGSATSYETDWSCAVVGTERIAVMAGEFDTYKIICKRFYISKSGARSNLREEKIWYYAPAVGHHVLATTRYTYKNNSKRQELLAVLPSLDNFSAGERRQLAQSFQQALEFKRSGEALRWSNPKLGASAEIMPTNTFQTPDGSYSRRYVQTLNLAQSQKTYYGMAVRNAEGVWTVPRK